MQKILLALFLICSFASFAQKEIDVLNYSFVLSLNDENDTIVGISNVTFHRNAGVKEVVFDLASETGKKGMKASSVYYGSNRKLDLPFVHADDKLTIQLPPATTTDTFSLIIWYRGVPRDGLIISKNKYGDRTFFADNWPNRAHHWVPCIDRPDDKASFEFVVSAPSHYQVISNGIKTEEKTFGLRKTTRWTETTPLPTKVMVIGVAKFATKTYENSPESIPVSAWVYPQDSTKGFYDYALAPDILKFFSDYIAPYPYKKLANVQSKTIFGGMENASAIFYAESSVTGDRSSEDLLAHEIAHQWFGDMASEKSFAHLWLSEGFATYLTNYYFEEKYGLQAAEKRWEKDREEVIAFAKRSSAPVVDSTKNLMSLLNANSYQKGAWVLRMLRHEVGDSIFQKIVQTYYNEYKGGNAETRDFEEVAEKVSGKELTWFFNQWLHRPGIPHVKIYWNQKQKKVRIVQTQKELFRFPIEILFRVWDGQSVDKTFTVQKKEEIFTTNIPLRKDENFEVDQNVKTLFSYDIIKE